MTRGRSICNVLKTIRTQIAKANEIKYEPRECHHTGECRGTCPACEAEVRYIERQLDIRRQLGKAVTIVGISAGLSALTGCGDKAKKVEEVERDSLTVGKVLVEPVERPSGEVEYQETDGIVPNEPERQQETTKKRTAPFFKAPLIKGQVDTAYCEVTKDSVDVIPIEGDVPSNIFGDVTEQMPMFRGGTNALMEYLAANIQYPEETCAQGRVIVTFVVERDGSITEPKVVRSIDPALDEEALRVVRGMPKWYPGKQNGVSVRVKYTLPVTFRLQ